MRHRGKLKKRIHELERENEELKKAVKYHMRRAQEEHIEWSGACHQAKVEAANLRAQLRALNDEGDERASEDKKTEEELEASRPWFCPNCTHAILSPNLHTAALAGDDREVYAWDIYCDVCEWSGDIILDSVN